MTDHGATGGVANTTMDETGSRERLWPGWWSREAASYTRW